MQYLAKRLRAYARESTEIAAGRRQQKRDKWDPRIGPGEGQRPPRNRCTKSKGIRAQDEAEIPLIALLLEPAPTDIAAIDKDRPMPQPIALPRCFLGGDKALCPIGIPRTSQKRHVPGEAWVGHVIDKRRKRDLREAREREITMRHGMRQGAHRLRPHRTRRKIAFARPEPRRG